MSMRFARKDILERLTGQIVAGTSILAVGAGNGLVTRCAEQGGADLIVVYNSGFFRLNGFPSLLGNLPVGDANEIMLRLGRQVIPATRKMPVVGGVYGVDVTRDMNDLLEAVLHTGYSGIINFPTVGRIDGQYRRDLEAAGLGFGREVDMIRLARSRDIFTMAYVYTPPEAEEMVRAGVDVLVGHVGFTAGGDVGSTVAMGLDRAVATLRAIYDRALAVRDDIILLSHGGPIATAKEAEYVNVHTRAMGFVAASSVERIPIEATLKEACHAFKKINVKGA